ncbi:UDP-glucose/GDP-mannose dehydrogenase family protein [Rhodocaloribacter litoris]|uniref:UDP-glucose dehydrogenase family protein n=1 Tax=Rhodocaloribacter litoris TaxID=2558931 RepID=UPI00141DAAA4|nr:UDP-glucose/GDP-mannose dehydrogenase family protein [Rhodocaloribacter litoris]QXD14336.1 UDP-glucose/GDP-mannose dehydrogenase family protein [Rhodocaloribacter litoris]
MKIAIIGTGYVGLVTGTCFAEMGNEVVCVDIDAAKIERLRSGKLTIFEPGLELFFERGLRERRLRFTTDLAEAVATSEVIFLALPTPPGEDGSADLSYVLGVAEDIGRLLAAEEASRYRILVNKSTVPVGTAERVRAVLEAAGLKAGQHFDVVSNPEFLREGVAVEDFMKPERVIIGTGSRRAAEIMTQLYEPFVRQGNPILVMDERSAEMTKYAANAFLATKITFMNEVANVCDRVGANVDKIRIGIGLDSRIGKHFLYAGIGFGGSCFPKDVQALARTAQAYGYDFEILEAVLRVNDRQRRLLVDRVVDYFGGDLTGRRIAVWGLAFKPNTDDVREAPSHVVIRGLLEHGAEVVAFDPEAIETTRAVLGDVVSYAEDDYAALQGADALVICTEWNEFRRPDFDRMRLLLKQPVIFDGRNLYDPVRMAEGGFDYYSIGRPHYAPVANPVSINGKA